MQRFPIDLGPPPARILLLVFVTHQSNSYVDVGPDAVAVRMGPVFQRRFPRDQVGSPRRRGWPILLGFGWRTDFSGLVGLTGTRRGVVASWSSPYRRSAAGSRCDSWARRTSPSACMTLRA